ncbi:hypothetical protein QAD02_007468 [Eretmocerus hayati]|uniref:Uncharacterized protein n=1 Tax=Eretmocerus hayati TaxID=131215 RepID=A0ACC2N4K5_9HYME|nr:hypothetical protein QAD02_007468 [Eretmocerus hayati]
MSAALSDDVASPSVALTFPTGHPSFATSADAASSGNISPVARAVLIFTIAVTLGGAVRSPTATRCSARLFTGSMMRSPEKPRNPEAASELGLRMGTKYYIDPASERSSGSE